MTIASLLTAVGAAVPNPLPQAPPGLDGFAGQFLDWLKWGGLVAALAGLVVCAIVMMIGWGNGPGGRRVPGRPRARLPLRVARRSLRPGAPWAATGATAPPPRRPPRAS